MSLSISWLDPACACIDPKHVTADVTWLDVRRYFGCTVCAASFLPSTAVYHTATGSIACLLVSFLSQHSTVPIRYVAASTAQLNYHNNHHQLQLTMRYTGNKWLQLQHTLP